VVAVGLGLGAVLREARAAVVRAVGLQAMVLLALQILEAEVVRVTLDRLAVLVDQVL
jgi:hypothetical protein